MTPDQFCYWLQGLFELAEPKSLSEKQAAMIKEHLQLVFEKKTTETTLEEALTKHLPRTDASIYGPIQPQGLSGLTRWC